MGMLLVVMCSFFLRVGMCLGLVVCSLMLFLFCLYLVSSGECSIWNMLFGWCRLLNMGCCF